jgi:hypothetical protein
MATASGDGKGPRRALLPFVAYALVLALLGLTGVALWRGGTGGSPAISEATPVEPAPAAQGLKLPPRPAEGEATVPSRQGPAPAPAMPSPPSQGPASNGDPAAAAAERAEPRKSKCTVDVGAWPADSTDQAKAIQILLRDLGFYSGTTYGTVGPATRAAIRKFQLAADEAETGEPSEMLFESLKKKCASPAP